jgi:HPt (histidine-containing phosphotransfer) domain-containing protein
LRELVGGDSEKTKRYLNMFMELTGPGLGQLAQAADQRDADGVRRLAHKIKGSCGMVGAGGMAAIAAEIEQRAGKGQLEGVMALVDRLRTAFDTARATITHEEVSAP